MRYAWSLVLWLSLASPGMAQGPAPFNAAAWREDVRVIAKEMPARHPNMFYRLPRARWDSAVAATESRISGLTRNQATVALMELVALVQDAHTTINPVFDGTVASQFYPIELHLFDDGLFIRSAAPEYAALAGAKVLRIGRVGTEEALAAVARILPHENEWWLKGFGPLWLGFAEILDGLGLVEDPEQLPLEVEEDGRRKVVRVRPVRLQKRFGHNPGVVIDQASWIDMRGGEEAPLWLRNPGRPYWAEYQPATRTLYVSYRAVISLDHGQSNVEFWRAVFAMADSTAPERLVLDLRENSGGNSFFNRQVIRGIIARPLLERPGRLFVITGPLTFSAAMNLTRDLEKWTNATFVGMPTGNATYFFGDHRQVVLPTSGITVNISGLPWPPYDARDRRDFVAPSIYTPLASADYRANRDPAMLAILNRGATPSLSQRIEAAIQGGDTLTAVRVLEEARRDVSRRFCSPEPEVNTLGYALKNARRLPAAIAVFRLNVRVFPRSANAWDSLGETLLEAGQRDEAIAAYHRALEIDPSFPPSRQALERLGVPLAR